MSRIVATPHYDLAVENHALRQYGMLGRGHNSHTMYSISFDSLPVEAKRTVTLIIAGGPFPYPARDGVNFGNRFGDLPSGTYLEFTVPTPGCVNRGARRIVARKTTAQLFFTACHYERIGTSGNGSAMDRGSAIRAAITAVDEQWQNGFYLITGLTIDQRNAIKNAITTRY